jgi:hypothetical protein
MRQILFRLAFMVTADGTIVGDFTFTISTVLQRKGQCREPRPCSAVVEAPLNLASVKAR